MPPCIFLDVSLPTDPDDLDRFVRAQAADYDQALSELRDGKKRHGRSFMRVRGFFPTSALLIRETTLELRALTVGQAYWVAIESFDENGVSTLSSPVPIR